jgi:glycosyltransferase involved in cell wall biosynthesis
LMKGLGDLPVEFTGRYVPVQLPEILDQIDIMVLPSICNDTAPQTIFESYSRSVPIVASNIGGFPDFVKDRINGRLFRPGDADQLADILDDIVSNPGQLSNYSKQIPKLKTIQQNAEELLTLYGSLRSARCSM